MVKKSNSLISIFFLLVLFTALLGLIVYKLYDLGYLNKAGISLPVYDPAPNFNLTERSGKKVSSENIKGRAWVASFIFTRCGGQCPLTNKEVDALRQQFKNILFISFTVDPEYDTPQILSDYAEGYGTNLNNWIFLTGKKEELNTVTTGFKMSKVDDPLMHSNRLVLIDQKGRVRGYYDVNDVEMIKKLKRDINILA